MGIKTIKVSKTGFQYPFQKYRFVNMKQVTYEFNLHNMSSGKVEFNLPVV